MRHSLRVIFLGILATTLFVILLLQTQTKDSGLSRHSLRKETLLPIQLISIFSEEPALNLNSAPVIGVFTQPSGFDEFPFANYSYIAASYIKFVESSGARVVPIPYEADTATLDRIFDQINGILVPGGGSGIVNNVTQGPTKFSNSVAHMLQRAIKANDEGDYFPFMAVCLGHETIHYILSGFKTDFLIPVINEAARSHYLNNTDRTAWIYRDLSDDLFQSVTTDNIMYYNHIWGVSPQLYDKYPILNEYLKITATNTDDTGTTYIASTQGVKYPFITSQYHPEKTNFEWKIPSNHSLNAIRVTQNHGDVFVDMTRRNFHTFSSQEFLQKALIYNYNVIQLDSSAFVQTYIFQHGQIKY